MCSNKTFALCSWSRRTVSHHARAQHAAPGWPWRVPGRKSVLLSWWLARSRWLIQNKSEHHNSQRWPKTSITAQNQKGHPRARCSSTPDAALTRDGPGGGLSREGFHSRQTENRQKHPPPQSGGRCLVGWKTNKKERLAVVQLQTFLYAKSVLDQPTEGRAGPRNEVRPSKNYISKVSRPFSTHSY